jgi:hypothetical protein
LLIDDFAPSHHFGERHATTVRASPPVVMRAVREVRASEVLLLRELLTLRGLPGVLTGDRVGGGDQRVLEWARAAGFVTLADADEELVLGLIGALWSLTAQPLAVADADEFAAVDRPDLAKAVMNLRADGGPEGPVTLSTETRVTIQDPGARRRFAAYWTVIRPGSGLLRHTLLRAVRRRAET